MLIAVISTAVYAENETQADPCAGVTCSSPPATTCDGNSVKTYSSPGTCSAGTCTYPSSATACQYGCSGGQCGNFCDTNTCTSTSKTCPDNFVSTCQTTCDRATQSCTSCEPSCEGHNVAPQPATNTTTSSGGGGGSSTNTTTSGGGGGAATNTTTSGGGGGGTPAVTPSEHCGSGSYNSNCICNGGETKKEFSPSCPAGMACPQVQTFRCVRETTTCPTPAIPQCSSDTYPEKKIDDKGCIIEYRCQPLQNQTNCMQIQTFAVDGSGRCSMFPNSCLSPGWTRVEKCPEPTQQQCPSGCECKYDNNNIIATSCPTQKGCNYNGMCDKDEDSSCKDCIGGECPVKQSCPGGAVSICRKTESGCACDPCPIPTADLPAGCTQETDSTGFVRVNCQKSDVKCATVPQEVRLKCVNNNGLPRFGRDSNGCDTFQCDFGGERSNSPVFATPVKCPSPEEVSSALEKCKSLSMEGVIGFEGGCKIGKCIGQNQYEKKPECINPTEDEKMKMELKCRQDGMGLVFEFNKYGCNEMKCGQRNDCQKDMPKDSYSACAEKGGQLIVRRDQNGCVSFTDCVRRGEESSSFVENINEVPDAGELLSIAFKLEDLKLQFDKLSKKTDDIANYYQSTGSSDEKRFRRVSDMFLSAKDKVDEIKNKLRDRSRDISVDDVMEIKQDIKYIKDVMLKDILYVMLGSGDDIEEIKNGTTTNCGTDGSCFDRAIRICQPIKFLPEGKDGTFVEIRGLADGVCILYAKLPESKAPPAGTIPGINPPYEMTCKLQKYSLGIRNPDTDIIPYCEGNLKEIMKYDKSKPEGTRQGVGLCGDNICDGTEQQNPSDCPQDCGPLLSKPLSQQQTTSTQQVISQPMQTIQTNVGGQLCPDGICDDFEQKNPNACPQDCGGTSPVPIMPLVSTTTVTVPAASGGGSDGVACSGCLNNGVCDPGECSGCADCLRG
ncbi:MAG TPA: hypothetical protein VJB05_01275 [archaeon]|nr:hypothetical protein [archaeon]